ncbi:MAG: hypothetical protein A3B66_07150 [Alphaproteobacteria bacterium RIFCSPHIGHO2_02_FULL_46_13]|nr:MAG: hypothetical protein A3B66_07150 [Alphaproteobacteria bacterium RIFCSPHIGHO2_02_FULL_46_13]
MPPKIVNSIGPKKLGWLLLFTSSTTLICCALPLLLVSLGLGAVSAALFSALPWLAWFGLYKIWTFSLAGLILAFAAWSIYRPNRYCPSDPAMTEMCIKTTRWNKGMFWCAAVLWFIGFFTAYLLLPIMRLMSL